MEAIYISSCIPYNGKSGGRLASYNHLLKLSEEYSQVYAFFVDVEYDAVDFKEESIPSNIKVTIFEREIKPVRNLYTAFIAIFRNIFSPFPRSMDVVYSKKMIAEIRKLYTKNKNIPIILDHFDAFSNLYKLDDLNILYVAHNNESELIYQKIFFDKKVNFLFNYLNYIKTKYFEKILLTRSLKIIFISSYDYDNFPVYKHKSIIFPEFIKLKEKKWKIDDVKDRSILFLGSSTHYPNKEATLWLINTFAPLLYDIDPSIKINICGLLKDSLNISNNYPKNLNFLGRVNDEYLESLFLSSRVFLSPVTLGSGVKIKVLESASYCLPVFLTPESLRGLSYLYGKVHTTERQDVHNFLNEFLLFFNDDISLLNQSNQLFEILSELQKDNTRYFTYLSEKKSLE